MEHRAELSVHVFAFRQQQHASSRFSERAWQQTGKLPLPADTLRPWCDCRQPSCYFAPPEQPLRGHPTNRRPILRASPALAMLLPMVPWCFSHLACDEPAQAARLGIAESGGDVVQRQIRFFEQSTSRLDANAFDEIAIADSGCVESALKGADAYVEHPRGAGDTRITVWQERANEPPDRRDVRSFALGACI